MAEEMQGQGADDGRAESLAALNAQVDSGAVAGVADPGAVAGLADPVEEAKNVIAFAVALFVPLYPSLERVFSEGQQERLAAVSVPLMQKYDISLGGIFERWGPEINFALVAVPMAQATVAAVRADKAALAAAQEAAEKQAREADGGGGASANG